MSRCIVLCLLPALLAACSAGRPPLNIRRDAYQDYLAKMNVGTDQLVDDTLPDIRGGRTARARGLNQLGHKTRLTVYVDRTHPMLLHVVTRVTPPCSECGGTGLRDTFLGIGAAKCLKCDGTGVQDETVASRRMPVHDEDLEPPVAQQDVPATSTEP